jgi:histidyl-tRNA synthetase
MNIKKSIQSVKGMNDCLPSEIPLWHYLEEKLTSLAMHYAYHEIRMPLVEKTDLFFRSIGEVTDIVEKEMYSFHDKGNEHLTLRPEGTASCVRAGIQNGLFYNQSPRLWYLGPMFRRERPQKGRYRQFYQFALEAFGFKGPNIDAEMIAFTARLWKILGFNHLRLEINSLGSLESRAHYKVKLVEYFQLHYKELDIDSQRRLKTNPLRILDSKNPSMKAMIQKAPQLMDYLDEDSQTHFEQLCQKLNILQIDYVINPQLVRGLDYYNKTVFEWITTELGAQGTLCAGGRYDGLVEQLGGKSTPALGFAMGLERIILLLQQQNRWKNKLLPITDVYFCTLGEKAHTMGLMLSEKLREAFPKMTLQLDYTQTTLKKQFRKAKQLDASIVLILEDDDIQKEHIQLKYLKKNQPQQWVLFNELIPTLSSVIISG